MRLPVLFCHDRSLAKKLFQQLRRYGTPDPAFVHKCEYDDQFWTHSTVAATNHWRYRILEVVEHPVVMPGGHLYRSGLDRIFNKPDSLDFMDADLRPPSLRTFIALWPAYERRRQLRSPFILWLQRWCML